jgi:hypothetical protein
LSKRTGRSSLSRPRRSPRSKLKSTTIKSGGNS